MIKEQLFRYYLGDEVVDLGESVASIHRYSGRCRKCGQWVSAGTIAHGSLANPYCDGQITKRQRVTVTIAQGPNYSPYRGWRRATPAERKAVLERTGAQANAARGKDPVADTSVASGAPVQRPASQGAA